MSETTKNRALSAALVALWLLLLWFEFPGRYALAWTWGLWPVWLIYGGLVAIALATFWLAFRVVRKGRSRQ